MEELLMLAKQCLSIIESSHLKDDEIEMLIRSAKRDMIRVEIDVDNNLDDDLVITTIMLYVKAHFGDTEINKVEYLNRYKSNLRELQFSDEYRIKVVDNNA